MGHRVEPGDDDERILRQDHSLPAVRIHLPFRRDSAKVRAMSIWGKLAGAAAGLAIGGPIGALIGAVAGHYAVDREGSADGGDPRAQVAFTIGVIALGAKMAKADGVVTSDEVSAFKQVFTVPPSEVRNVARIFNLAKQDVAGYEAYAGQLAGLFRDDRQMLEDVLDGLFHIAKADDVVHPAELEYLESVAGIFGFGAHDFARIKARHIVRGRGDPYLVLGLDPGARNEEVKGAWRRLVAENHPDRHIARGMPEEFIAIANDKIAAINAAYDDIRKERGL
jgi:DnaJ like chaperone protein